MFYHYKQNPRMNINKAGCHSLGKKAEKRERKVSSYFDIKFYLFENKFETNKEKC